MNTRKDFDSTGLPGENFEEPLTAGKPLSGIPLEDITPEESEYGVVGEFSNELFGPHDEASAKTEASSLEDASSGAKGGMPVNQGFIKSLGNEVAADPTETGLREACVPFVQALIDGKIQDKVMGRKATQRMEGLKLSGGKTREVLDAYFGFGGEPPKSLDEISRDRNFKTTPYGVTMFLRTALKEIIQFGTPEAQEAAKAYLDYLDEHS